MSWEKAFAIGAVTAFSCVFWLGVNILDGWVQRNVYPVIRLKFYRLRDLLREKIVRRHAAHATNNLGSARRIREKHIGD